MTCHGLHTGQRIDSGFRSTALLLRLHAARIDEAATGSDRQPVWTQLDL